jgi:hypothetical protein
MSTQKPLRLTYGFEPAHAPLPNARRLMRKLRSIVLDIYEDFIDEMNNYSSSIVTQLRLSCQYPVES